LTTRICPVCKHEAGSPHHVKPRSEGGTDETRNIVWLCEDCHNEAERIFDETGLEYSPKVARLIRGLLGFSVSSGREREHVCQLVPRCTTELTEGQKVMTELAGMKRELLKYKDLCTELGHNPGSTVTCKRCGRIFICSDGRYAMCMECRMYVVSCLGLFGKPTIKLIGYVTDETLAARSYKLERVYLLEKGFRFIKEIEPEYEVADEGSGRYIRITAQ